MNSRSGPALQRSRNGRSGGRPEPDSRFMVPVAVITSVRNGARYLTSSLRTVLEQAGPPFELIVVDDGSTDETPALLEDLARRDDRVRPLRAAGQGLTRALMEGIGRSESQYIARHDA